MNPTNASSVLLPSTATDLTPEDPRTVGPFRLLKRLGSGGMGVVYAGADGQGRVVAVKVVHTEYASDVEFRARFAREVDLLGRVGGACAVPLLGADPGAARPWLATAYVVGATLGAYVRRNGPLEQTLQRGLAAGVAEALTRIHDAGIAHRDLKPSNIILSPDGPRVLDFGIARAIDETALTRTGSVVGSPGWISPDHYKGAPASFSDDVFAWGAMVAYSATGRPPFGRGNADAIGYRVLHEQPDLHGFNGELADLARAALSKDARQRPTAPQLLAATASIGQRFAASVASAPEATHVLSRVLDDNWTGVQVPTGKEFAVEAEKGGGRRIGTVVAASLVALALLLTAGGAAVAAVTGEAPWKLVTGGDSGAAQAGQDPGPDQAGPDLPSGSPSTNAKGKAEKSDKSEAQEKDGKGGEPGEKKAGAKSTTGMAVLGPAAGAGGAKPSGAHVVGLAPTEGGKTRWARLDGAQVLCAWSFCQSAGNKPKEGAPGTTPSSPGALSGHLAKGNAGILAEVTYKVDGNGVATISKVVEHHRSKGDGVAPPWA
ncbi:serine/threonine-protein kinase [Murinocardiopsis flavida]|uniref:serine/threonine-protein kinase n=1 Tax=Murinocardiopsis flavida TaxID=645275 RepID=UPI001FED19C9|nr:serine/threonine-protein kinase [Murinocardiopsis flavida]